VLDDALARRVAQLLDLPLTGTLGLPIDAKKAGLIVAVEPWLDRLQALRFHLAERTRTAVLRMAGEVPVLVRSNRLKCLSAQHPYH